ncbi:hypothetical protein [Flavobacterium nackdongense]|jgi:hypothetical protein|uniref:Uncharacterized protein n=1 Tax=Flavobacterium nackdongense TaxID=2547394 RepID=A0A4V1AG96_9FLAO|nr:hypothetical protein [Flavobacterium nackdongense]QBN17272.1 hypothetical protein E1750_00110 [Flavobacterium nackdongense]
MSILHYIKTKEPINFVILQKVIERTLEDVKYEQRSETLCYFWIDEASTRGVDVSLEEENWIELRNTGFSSKEDYLLTNELANSICNLYDGQLYIDNEEYDEESDDASLEYIPKEHPLFTTEDMEAIPHTDTQVVSAMALQLQQTITLFCPIRKVHFGPELLGKLSEKSNEELTILLHKIILYVNYQIPNYEYGNVLEMGEGEDKKTLKLLANQSNCIIDKYDFILFQKEDDKIIAITNDTLNTILPKSWQRVDEYTIVATILPEDEFINLVAQAEKLNQYNELRK